MSDEKNEHIITIYKTSDASRAEIIRQCLASEGIEAQVSGAHQGGLAGLDIMMVEVLVRESDRKAAQAIIDATESN